MTNDSTRRFTDREVALVLRKAVEIDESEGSGAGVGLSLQDLREIAREVGISPTAIERAVHRIEGPSTLPALWTGAPLVRKAVRAVPGELDRDAIARLIQVVDERTDTAGTISEAVGSVRWTGSDRFKSSFVSITPGGGETSIQVVEKSVGRLRRIFHFIPAAWGLMLVAPLAGGAGVGVAGGIGLAALSALAGAGVGRVVWNVLSGQSARRVERLAAALADEARAAGRQGLPAPEPPPVGPSAPPAAGG